MNFENEPFQLMKISNTSLNQINSDVQNPYQDKSSTDMTLNQSKYLTSTCWNEKYPPITIDMKKDKYTGRYSFGLISIFVPDSSPFCLTKGVFIQMLLNKM